MCYSVGTGKLHKWGDKMFALNDIKKKDDLADPLYVLLFLSRINIFILGMFNLYGGEK